MTVTTAIRTRWFGRVAVLAVIAAIGFGLWYAGAHGWLNAPYDWARHLLHKDQPEGSSQGGMNMPGMDMGSMPMGKPSEVPGHAEVTLPGEVQQRIGVTVGRVEEAPLRMTVRTVGIVQPNETKVAHLYLKTEGWIEKLFVDYTGQHVRQGDPLLAIYSPEFLNTQQDYLTARQANPQSEMARLARRRLELWDVPAEEIDKLAQTGPEKYLTLRSPLAGTVLTKNAFVGQHVSPQTELYAVADLSTVWVQAKVYEYELPHVQEGQPATVTLAALPGRELTGKVVFVQPTVQEPARTVQVRVELPNKDDLLKPGMFANVVIEHEMGKGLLVPASAVLRTGERDVAYRVQSEGRFVPVEVQVGRLRYGDRLRVLKGLKEGEQVVTSANFLIDSESRLRAGGGMMNMPGMDMGGKGKKDEMKDMPGMKGMDHDKMKH
jgi:Cu(I)/Ag(I) efflux system membrane fusion protein